MTATMPALMAVSIACSVASKKLQARGRGGAGWARVAARLPAALRHRPVWGGMLTPPAPLPRPPAPAQELVMEATSRANGIVQQALMFIRRAPARRLPT